MTKTAATFYAVEYRTNMMRSDAPILPLGHLVRIEIGDSVDYIASVDPTYREWYLAVMMGLHERCHREYDAINLETWPELEGGSKFLTSLCELARTARGIEGVLGDFGFLSAVRVFPVDKTAGAISDNFNTHA